MSGLENNDILDRINALKNNYYCENKKNLFFKKDQKFDCAQIITQQFNTNELFKNILLINQNKLCFNYTLFKTVVYPGNYMDFIKYIFITNDEILETYSEYDIICDLKGLTMTGVERYKGFLTLLSNEGLANGKNFLQKLGHIFILNPPFMISNIAKIILPVLDKIVQEKIVMP
jgi:hypothetical protein